MGFHDFNMQSIEGAPVDFRTFAGTFNLIVNVASR